MIEVFVAQHPNRLMRGRLANISGKEALKAFQNAGWEVIGQVSSHVVMSKPGVRVNLFNPSTQRAIGPVPFAL